jgi:hypothetical protein
MLPKRGLGDPALVPGLSDFLRASAAGTQAS